MRCPLWLRGAKVPVLRENLLIDDSVNELVRILSSVDRNFAEVDDLASSLPGLIQRLDEIIKIQFDTREQGDVSEFDFIGNSCGYCI